MEKPDFSVSSGALRVEGPEEPKVGDALVISAPIRNLGAVGAREVPVALQRSVPGGQPIELARQWVTDIPLVGEKMVSFPWTAGAGDHTLSIVVDPDNELGDWSRSNNTALASVNVEGDDQQPTLTLEGLAAEAVLNDSVFEFRAAAEDDAGIARVWRRLSTMDCGRRSRASRAGGRSKGYSNRASTGCVSVPPTRPAIASNRNCRYRSRCRSPSSRWSRRKPMRASTVTGRPCA